MLDQQQNLCSELLTAPIFKIQTGEDLDHKCISQDGLKRKIYKFKIIILIGQKSINSFSCAKGYLQPWILQKIYIIIKFILIQTLE